jgi:hypothetical protein
MHFRLIISLKLLILRSFYAELTVSQTPRSSLSLVDYFSRRMSSLLTLLLTLHSTPVSLPIENPSLHSFLRRRLLVLLLVVRVSQFPSFAVRVVAA